MDEGHRARRPAHTDGLRCTSVGETGQPFDDRNGSQMATLTVRTSVPVAMPAATSGGIVVVGAFYSSVFIGRIEGDHPVELSHPDSAADAPPTIMTWCLIRVLRSYRGGLQVGELVTVLFDGGAIAADYQVWRSHALRCLPFDEGIFTLYEHRSFPGLLRPSDGGTVSFIRYAQAWEENP